MFPIPWNKAFRKKDGTLVNIADAMSGGGGGSEIPDYDIADAGKVLGVNESGELEWIEVSSKSTFSIADQLVTGVDYPYSDGGELNAN